MRTDLADAVESARTVSIDRPGAHIAEPQRRHSRNTVVAILKSVAQDLPAEMTMGDLLEELGG